MIHSLDLDNILSKHETNFEKPRIEFNEARQNLAYLKDLISDYDTHQYPERSNQHPNYWKHHARELFDCNDSLCKDLRALRISRFNKLEREIFQMASCEVCTKPKDDCSCERNQSPNPPRLVGFLRDMSFDDYIKYFNDSSNLNAFTELKRLIFIDEKKPVLEMSIDERIQFIERLELARNILSVVIHKSKAAHQSIYDAADEETKKEIKKKDRAYKVKDQVINDTQNVLKKREASAKTKEEKMRANLKGMGMSETEIDQFLIKQRSK